MDAHGALRPGWRLGQLGRLSGCCYHGRPSPTVHPLPQLLAHLDGLQRTEFCETVSQNSHGMGTTEAAPLPIRRYATPWYSSPRFVGPAPFREDIANSAHDPQFPAPGGSCTPPRRPRPDRRQMLFSKALTCSWTPYFHDAYAPTETAHLNHPRRADVRSAASRELRMPSAVDRQISTECSCRLHFLSRRAPSWQNSAAIRPMEGC